MKIFNSTKYKMILIFVICLIIILGYFQLTDNGEMSNFNLINNRLDDTHLIHGERVLVGSTIIDMQSVGNYTIGLHLPIKYLACNENTSSKIRIVNIRQYFILNNATLQTQKFDSKQLFVRALRSIDLEQLVNLDYDRFDFIWNKFSKLYERDTDGDVECSVFPEGTIEYSKSEWGVRGN